MRILHLISSHRWTGAAEPAADLALAQRALGHETEVACIEGASLWRQLKKLGADRAGGFDLRAGFHPFGAISDIKRLRALIAEKKYDAVHCHLQHDHWIAAIALGRMTGGARRGGPVLVRTFHRDASPRADFIHRRLYARATDLLITVSRSGQAEAMRRLGLDESRVAWIRGAVDLDRFHPGIDKNTNRAIWSIAPETPVAGIVARMQPHRGHLTFIDTIGEVAREVPGAYYVIAGRGELKRKIRHYARAHPHKDQLRRVGYRRHDLPETYAALDVSVLLAQGSDGTCRAMLEAMACGRPVIGANVGAIADTIEEGKTGWLVDPNDPKRLTRALIEALGDLKRTAEMGRAARKKMEEEFTQQKRAMATLEAYERVRGLTAKPQ
ncbi:glycosyltransferase family 4 protein [Candidatus Sumerlaeota bacterium]|nr:glycosyltransferase family 4 protein [Candidatus Sumerlaeota bacterium]